VVIGMVAAERVLIASRLSAARQVAGARIGAAQMQRRAQRKSSSAYLS
jgi:hypothetical protein